MKPVWNAAHIHAVDIVWDETSTARGRAGYYDNAGAAKDMIQNHLLQLLVPRGHGAPATMGRRDLRNCKTDVLRAVQPPPADRMRELTRRARYTAGSVNGRHTPSYVEERVLTRTTEPNPSPR